MGYSILYLIRSNSYCCAGERVGAGVTSAAKEGEEVIVTTSELITMKRMRCFLDISLLLINPSNSAFTVEIVTFNFVKNL
jgi:hypothetical protein